MLKFKHGTRLAGLQPVAVLALVACERVYAKHGHECRLTSGTDGQHKAGSLHHVGHAFDLGLPGDAGEVIIAELKLVLGDEFDVLLEADHIHVEYDP